MHAYLQLALDASVHDVVQQGSARAQATESVVEPQSHASPYSTMELPHTDPPSVKQKPPELDEELMRCERSLQRGDACMQHTEPADCALHLEKTLLLASEPSTEMGHMM